MAQLEKKSFNAPDQTMTPPKAENKIVTVGGKMVMRAEFQPGWKWSNDIGAAHGMAICDRHHFGYIESGTLAVRMQNGTELEATAGDVVDIPPGHDAWVVGDAPVVLIDFGGLDSK